MRSAVIVYNPTAGRYSVRPFIKSVVKELESAGWKVDAEATKSGDHTIELAKQASTEKRDAVFAVGACYFISAFLIIITRNWPIITTFLEKTAE